MRAFRLVVATLIAGASAAAAAQPNPAATAAPAASGKFALVPGAQADFLAQCRKDYVSRSADAARWADGQCEEDWKKVTASGPAAEALLAALPATPGEALPVAALKKRMAGVRWATKPGDKTASASGTLGGLFVAARGAPNVREVGVNWMEVGALPPYDIVSAMRVRGVTLTEVACEDLGTGEWQRSYAGSTLGRVPFRLDVGERTAPTADANSYYGATLHLSGKAPAPARPQQRCGNPANR